MHVIGEFARTFRNLNGDLEITFVVDDDALADLEKLKDKELVIDVEPLANAKSQQANKYFWKLCDLIARAIGSDKYIVYLMKLRDYGTFADVTIHEDSIPEIATRYRYSEVEDDYGNGMVELRCYKGLSQYSNIEISHLINGTVFDAREIGVKTLTDIEIDNIINDWKGQNEKNK